MWQDSPDVTDAYDGPSLCADRFERLPVVPIVTATAADRASLEWNDGVCTRLRIPNAPSISSSPYPFYDKTLGGTLAVHRLSQPAYSRWRSRTRLRVALRRRRWQCVADGRHGASLTPSSLSSLCVIRIAFDSVSQSAWNRQKRERERERERRRRRRAKQKIKNGMPCSIRCIQYILMTSLNNAISRITLSFLEIRRRQFANLSKQYRDMY